MHLQSIVAPTTSPVAETWRKRLRLKEIKGETATVDGGNTGNPNKHRVPLPCVKWGRGLEADDRTTVDPCGRRSPADSASVEARAGHGLPRRWRHELATACRVGGGTSWPRPAASVEARAGHGLPRRWRHELATACRVGGGTSWPRPAASVEARAGHGLPVSHESRDRCQTPDLSQDAFEIRLWRQAQSSIRIQEGVPFFAFLSRAFAPSPDEQVAHRDFLATTPKITELDNLTGLRMYIPVAA